MIFSDAVLSVDDTCTPCEEGPLRRFRDNIFRRSNGDNIFRRSNGRRKLDEAADTGLAIVQVDFQLDDPPGDPAPSNAEIEEALEDDADAVNGAFDEAGVQGTAFPDGGATSPPTAYYSTKKSKKKSKSSKSKSSKSGKKSKSSKKYKSYYSYYAYYSKKSKSYESGSSSDDQASVPSSSSDDATSASTSYYSFSNYNFVLTKQMNSMPIFEFSHRWFGNSLKATTI